MSTTFVLPLAPVFAQTPPGSGSPVISNLTADNITSYSAIISWSTDVPATTRLDYGSTLNYEITPIIDSGLRTSHQVQVSPLDAGALYHYRARSTGASGGEQIGADSTFTTKPPLDFRPPDEIASLRVASATITSLTLTWIAVGDDGSVGTSSSYEIRTSYTTVPDIGALQWWNSGVAVNTTLTPNGPGSRETYTLQNLATGTVYYVAVRARDKAGNISPISISDIRSGTTLAALPTSVGAITLATPTVILSPAPAVGGSASLIASSSAALGGSGSTSTPTLPLIATRPDNSVQPSQSGRQTPSTSSATHGTPVTGNLSYGMRNESIKTLQRILIAKGFLPLGSDSGFFGALTRRAVQKFQCAQKIVCSGSPARTGYGSVGAKTRARLGGM